MQEQLNRNKADLKTFDAAVELAQTEETTLRLNEITAKKRAASVSNKLDVQQPKEAKRDASSATWQSTAGEASTPTCWRCGQEGHKSPTCPNKDAQKSDKKNKTSKPTQAATVNKTTSQGKGTPST